MGFSQLERINIAAKALQAGVIDANPSSVWYEVFFPFTFVMSSEQVWTEMPTLRGLRQRTSRLHETMPQRTPR